MSSQQEYDLDEFAHKYDLSRGEAATIIRRYGPLRSKLDAIMAHRSRSIYEDRGLAEPIGKSEMCATVQQRV